MSHPDEFPASEQLLAAIVDSSDDAIISKDLNSVIRSWNAGAERIFGYTAAEMIGKPIHVIFPPDRQDEERLIIERLQRGERVEHFQTIRVRKDGTLIDVSLTISPVRNAAGQVVGASKIARDITPQIRAMRELAEAHEALKRADRLKAEFLGTLSHELRTPLTAILGWIEILKGEEGAADLAQGLEVIERNVRLQSKLIEDLLDLSRIEAGKVRLDIQPLDVTATVLAAMDAIRPTADAKGVMLTSAFATVDGVVMGDRHRLQQVVWNLLTNAIKFTPQEGMIHVSIELVDSFIRIAVTDSGQGIAPEFVAHVFERFRQADPTTTRRHGGLGIGLSIVKSLTELHGGTVEAYSPGVGKGATFSVKLPLASLPGSMDNSVPREGTDAVGTTTPGPNLAGVRVLLTEDEKDTAEVIRRILERRGATVRTAHSMHAALEQFSGFSPHVVLSDIGMPEHDGFELLAELRRRPGGRFVPVVAFTAMARNEDRAQALLAGFQMHLAKPVDAADLLAAVQSLATQHIKAGGG